MQELSDLWRATASDDVNVSGDFSPREFAAALHNMKPGKASGPGSVCPEFVIHAGPGFKFWLRGFLSSCLRQLKISKVWRRALVVMIRKPSKPVENSQSYCFIFLLCSSHKILERLIYNPVELLLAEEQAGFRHGNSTIDQVVLHTQNIEDYFEPKKKTGAVFVNLTAAYDTVWHRGLTCKLLRLLSDKHMVRMIVELVRTEAFP